METKRDIMEGYEHVMGVRPSLRNALIGGALTVGLLAAMYVGGLIATLY